MRGMLSALFGGSLLFFAASPSSASYNLKSYDFGNGGTDASSSASFSINGESGTVGDTTASSASFTALTGLNPTQNANVPPAPTLSNPDGYYDRLKLVINEGSNPSDTKYLIAISSDNFATFRYVQPDTSTAASYTIANFQTYAAWGGASGFFITSLTQSTTYEVRVRAFQGTYSDSGFGPKSSAIATLAPSLSFGISTTLTAVPPYQVGFTSLPAGSVFNGDADGIVALTSNARLGSAVYIKSANAGLRSVLSSFTLASATADLSSAGSGFGAQVTSVSQSAGGPLTSLSPYNGASQNVGALGTALQTIMSSSGPLFGGSGTVRFKAKTDAVTPASPDYADTITFIAAINL